MLHRKGKAEEKNIVFRRAGKMRALIYTSFFCCQFLSLVLQISPKFFQMRSDRQT